MQPTNPQASSEPFQRRESLQPRIQQRNQRGYPLLVVFALVVIALIVAILPINTVSAAAAQELANCDGGTLVRRLSVVDQAQTDPETIDAALAEAEAIWATANVRLVWLRGGPHATPPDGYIVVRGGRSHPIRDAAMMKSGGLRQLGWVRFERDGRRANLVEASLPAIRAIVMNTWYLDRRLRFHNHDLQLHLLGRALGRVIAHEVGHWLIGLGHTDEGLMKPTLRHDDLVTHRSPKLPPTWTDATDSRLAALRARCG